MYGLAGQMIASLYDQIYTPNFQIMAQAFDTPTIREQQIKAPVLPDDEKVLTSDALQFLTLLHREFNSRRVELLENRVKRQLDLDNGHLPDFLPDTNYIREQNWSISPLPDSLQDRRV